MELSQTRLLVTHMAASVAFYRDVLGLALSWGDEKSSYASFSTGGGKSQLALFAKNEMGHAVQIFDATEGADRAVIVFAVADLDAALDRVRDHGVHLLQEPVDKPTWGLRVAYLRDPDDNLVELAYDLPRQDWDPQLLADAQAQTKTA
jgi:catechol 2,3-dioxygenase-like lactoylglutathione lyase family enzyme